MIMMKKIVFFWSGILCLTAYSAGAVIYGTMTGLLDNLTTLLQAGVVVGCCILGAGKFLLHYMEEKDFQNLLISTIFIAMNISIGGALFESTCLVIIGVCVLGFGMITSLIAEVK